MWEIIERAAQGWTYVTDAGKYPVLLLAALLFGWCTGEKSRRKERSVFTIAEDTLLDRRELLLLYGTVMAILVICPVTAGILMKYQTLFYDYVWLWGLVPQTAVIAWAVASTCTQVRSQRQFGSLKLVGWGVICLGLLLLCGNLGNTWWTENTDSSDREGAQEVLDYLEAQEETEICMVAPSTVLSWIRALDGDVTLLYGRNMWDAALNAYSYDTYDETVQGIYAWMEGTTLAGASSGEENAEPTEEVQAEEDIDTSGEEESVEEEFAEEESAEEEDDVYWVAKALERGVNCILLEETAAADLQMTVRQTMENYGYTVTEGSAGGYLIYIAGQTKK